VQIAQQGTDRNYEISLPLRQSKGRARRRKASFAPNCYVNHTWQRTLHSGAKTSICFWSVFGCRGRICELPHRRDFCLNRQYPWGG